jgi:hypothetical protein
VRIKNVSWDDDDATVSVDFKSFIGDNEQNLAVVPRPVLEIPDEIVPSPVISSIISNSPISNFEKPVFEKQATDLVVDTFQKQMIQFFEGDDGWEDVDGLSNRNTNNNGISTK